MSSTHGRPTTALSKEEEVERREAEHMLYLRRREMRAAAWIAAILLALTMYFGALNALLLYREYPKPFGLKLSQSKGSQLVASYRPAIIWRSHAGYQGVVRRPILLLGGARIPSASSRRHGSDPMIGLDQLAELRIVVPSGTTPGLHQGRLLLDRVSGDPDLPEQLSQAVKVGVIGGFWSSWWLFGSWLIVMLIFLTLFYAFCVWMFPRPAGRIYVQQSGGTIPRKGHVELKMRRLAYLMPWKRSSVPLRTIAKRAALPHFDLPAGSLEFRTRDIPYLDWTGVTTSCRPLRLGHGQTYTPGMILPRCGIAEPMYADNFVCSGDGHVYTVFRYEC